MKRRIVVLYQVDDSVRIEEFTCVYERQGDFSLSRRGDVLSLTMRDGRDEQGRRVHVKVFMHAWEATVFEIQGI